MAPAVSDADRVADALEGEGVLQRARRDGHVRRGPEGEDEPVVTQRLAGPRAPMAPDHAPAVEVDRFDRHLTELDTPFSADGPDRVEDVPGLDRPRRRLGQAGSPHERANCHNAWVSDGPAACHCGLRPRHTGQYGCAASAHGASTGPSVTRDTAPIKLSSPESETDKAAALATVLLRHERDYWTLTYLGTTARLKDAKGLHYLAQLLRHAGQEFHALDLVQGSEAGVQSSGGQNLRPRTRDSGLDVLDATAKSAYKRRVAELREELEEAEEFNDTGGAARAREEIEAISEQLSAAVGLGGRNRAAGSSAERARSTVTKRIKDAIKAIAAASPALGAHLNGRVR